MNSHILDAEAQHRITKESLLQTIHLVQLGCFHRNVVEAPYKTYEFWNTSSYYPAFRVCEDCGLKEEGDSSYKALKTEYTKKVTRDEAQLITRHTS